MPPSDPHYFQFVLCLIAAIIYAVNTVWLSKSWYLLPENDTGVETPGLAGFLNSMGIVRSKMASYVRISAGVRTFCSSSELLRSNHFVRSTGNGEMGPGLFLDQRSLHDQPHQRQINFSVDSIIDGRVGQHHSYLQR